MPANVETMMSVRERPWHGLGVVLPEYPKSKEELMDAAGLSWSVGEFPVTVELPDGTKLTAEDRKGIVRLTDNSLLSIMGGGYQPIQPSTLVDFAYALLEVDEDTPTESGEPPILFETAMSLSGGKVNTLLARIPKDVKVGGEDPVDLYLSFVNSHDGSLKFGVHVTPIRVCCQNTLNLSLKTATQSWSIKHSQSAMSSIEEARKTLNLSVEYAEAFEAAMNALIEQEFSKRDFERLVGDLFPKSASERAPFSREQYSMIGLLESSPTIHDASRYTRWGALNAVTEFMDWNTRFNEGGAPVAEKRTMHTLFGRAKVQADRAYSYLAK
jgi:phage/plasmid-like protein (TIGR03299 family)